MAAIQRAPLAEPVKTQIAAWLIVMLGSAPELGFVRIEYKNQGNEIIPQTGMGGNIPFCRLGLCDSGLFWVRGCPWGDEVIGLYKLRKVE